MEQSDIRTWWANPLSKDFIKQIEEAITILTYEGNTESMCRDTVKNAIRVGTINGLRMVLQMKETEIKEQEDEQAEDSADTV